MYLEDQTQYQPDLSSANAKLSQELDLVGRDVDRYQTGSLPCMQYMYCNIHTERFYSTITLEMN